ncbi:MAG TPA: hypothetical protein VNW46_15305 [Gemmatimonadaceae bacterium]|nr:hypothetical protein [Gemmatimonadaceae bacterium]
MRQHTINALKALTMATAVVTAAACGSSGNGSSGGGNTGGGPVSGHSTTITATGTSTMGGGGGNPYSTAPLVSTSRAANPYFFTPTPDTVAVGATVTYVFQNVAHTVTFDTPGSPANISSIAAGGVANADSMRVFATAGSFNYHCSIHPFMTGTVVVK